MLVNFNKDANSRKKIMVCQIYRGLIWKLPQNGLTLLYMYKSFQGFNKPTHFWFTQMTWRMQPKLVLLKRMHFDP